VDQKKFEFNWRHLVNTIEASIWTDRDAVWVVDSGGLKEVQVQLYSPGGANVPSWEPSWEGTLSPLGDYDRTIHLWRRCGLMPYVKLLWPLVIGSRPSDQYLRSLSVCLFVQSFSQPSLIRFHSN